MSCPFIDMKVRLSCLKMLRQIGWKKRENKKEALCTLFHNFFSVSLEQSLQIYHFYVPFQDQYPSDKIEVKSSQLGGYSIFSVGECHMLL